jgi:hypothetical protein
VTFAFELCDDPILIVDLPLAEDHVLLGSGQQIKPKTMCCSARASRSTSVARSM